DRLDRRVTFSDAQGSVFEDAEVPLDLLRPRAREQGQDRRARVEAELLAERIARRRDRRRIEQRMAHEHRTGARLAEHLLLERKNDREPVRVGRQLAAAAAMPRPDLWGDVVENRNPRAA